MRYDFVFDCVTVKSGKYRLSNKIKLFIDGSLISRHEYEGNSQQKLENGVRLKNTTAGENFDIIEPIQEDDLPQRRSNDMQNCSREEWRKILWEKGLVSREVVVLRRYMSRVSFSPRRMAKTRNVSHTNSLLWTIWINNSVNKAI